MNLSFFALFKIIMQGKSALRFLLASLISIAFSISVILCTIGLMDGFERTLKESLRQSSGDINLYKKSDFFLLDKKTQDSFLQFKDYIFSAAIQTESFILEGNESKGVLVHGIIPQSFNQVTQFDFNLNRSEAAIGHELAKKLSLKKGDAFTLVFASSSKRSQGAPILREFILKETAKHGIYEKDSRLIYVRADELSSILNLKKGYYNLVNVKVAATGGDLASMEQIKSASLLLNKKLKGFRAYPFWSDFKTLLEAVEVEKFSITLILQLIVIVAIFNIVAFMIFISEKKSQEIFLLRSMGLEMKKIAQFWVKMNLAIWVLSCFISIFMAKLFNLMLMYLPLFKVPGDIYVMSELSVSLELSDYVIVFSSAFAWMLLITTLTIFRIKKKAVIAGLRREFA